MNVVKCVNGHFFDKDKYSKCPHCGEHSSSKTSILEEKPKQHEERKSREFDNDPSISLGDFMSDEGLVNAISSDESDGSEITSALMWKDLEKPGKTTLQREIQQASASNDNKTLGYFSRIYEGQIPDQSDKHIRKDPVTGWLVCIAGPHFGESFSIVAGNNSIGRESSNKIVLDRDKSVSGEKHTIITYEPKTQKFYIHPGDSSGLTYLNDAFIMNSHELEARAIIEIGSSRFIFIPLCGPEFSWEKYMNK